LSISFHYAICLSSIFSISFHNFLLYFPNLFTFRLTCLPYFSYLFTFQLIFLPYFSYLFTIQLAFLPYCPYLFTIKLAFLPYFPYHFTIFFCIFKILSLFNWPFLCIFHIFSLFNLLFFHIFPIFSLFNLRFFHMFYIFYSLFLMILSNQNFLLSVFANFPRLIPMIQILTSYAMTMILWCLLSEQWNLYINILKLCKTNITCNVACFPRTWCHKTFHFTVLFQTATFEIQRYLFSVYVTSFSAYHFPVL
jgi:hypothetical protein